eukprot:TRINITY_DN2639_c0_g1_i2.p1 TRINITY_DN2639_c0_g1~~TRINITY_DN2639_c0_g1_i2.p1  ORF type:complete len:278 (-),score=60.55 TRINITY_DN2639_c0_g1_i2:65-898(-)
MSTSGRERFLYTVDDPDNKQRRGRLSTSFLSSFGLSRFVDIKLFVISVFLMSLIVFLLSLTQSMPKTTGSGSGSAESTSDAEHAVGPLSWNPRIFYHSHFASAEDVAELIEMGEKLAQEQHPANEADNHSSWCIKISDKSSAALKRISDRMSLWAVLPPSHGEEFCLIRQEAAQAADLPTLSDDLPAAKDPSSNSGKRKVTLILHLNTIEDGMDGELLFPKAANGPLKVPAFAGDALLLWNQNPDRTESAGAVWGSKAPKQGIKWSLVRWLRERPLA